MGASWGSAQRPAVPPPHGGTLEKRGNLRLRPASAPATRAWQWRWPWSARRKITFRPTVRVTEFKRVLDGGGTVPGDGTMVTLGLGQPLRMGVEPLAAPRRPDDRPVEERVWLPNRDRIRILRASMGDARFFVAWARHRRELKKIRRSRQLSNSDGKDCQLMPVSIKDARERALQLSKEFAVPAATAPQPEPQAVTKKQRSSAGAAPMKEGALKRKSQCLVGEARTQSLRKLKKRPRRARSPTCSPQPCMKYAAAAA
mmetsp:Transcript_54876/g.117764  ORF Transcript_54876/g.117764 Transcript_54876/m.117764 type:complete len:257 (-) Transcript_54876:187-957(-)